MQVRFLWTLVKRPRSGFSYIGLQTNSTFTDTYAWLDVVALSEVNYYYRLKRLWYVSSFIIKLTKIGNNKCVLFIDLIISFGLDQN
jgi:hypothetical protein